MISKDAIFNIKSEAEFTAMALDIFRFQFKNNIIYRSFCDLLYKHPSEVKQIKDIPFLPIQFFKTHHVLSTSKTIEKTFTSSGTIGSKISKHLITDLKLYESSYLQGFEYFYGNIEDYVVLALLPSYLERDGSSLIYMVNDLITKSKHPESGFYLNNLEDLAQTINQLEAKGQKTLLIGVSFALLDMVEQFQFNLNHTLIMETGGMKGRRKEIVRQELHNLLKSGFGVNKIHSEYGMTELLSQAYSIGNGIFESPPWMKILTRDTEDALTLQQINKTGGVNVIDLANLNSCTFIATQDLGKVYNDGKFEIIGRFDNSDIRGCNLMAL
ncbi:acyl transferase [uncultured Winogradskyella sp.]|uniref:LuxE/PaaK family acyltransferase n=1 Tax=uncultured Winogradskyella sp. TaxID=395353 RepID=UPI00261CDF89|nr:acyl transferase [uncultured Winogradskyella sp.]